MFLEPSLLRRKNFLMAWLADEGSDVLAFRFRTQSLCIDGARLAP